MEKNRHFQLLDCSLRDGGYYTKWDFKTSFVEAYLNSLNDLPVDYVEIGYRSNPRKGYLGAYFYCPDYILEAAAKASNKKLAIILNEKEVELSDLDRLLTSCKGIISMVRIAVAPEKVMSSLSLANKIREMGFEVTLNVMYLSKWHQDSIFVSQLKEVEQVVNYLYLVDSYGGMFPDQLRQVLNRIKMESEIKTGFHAHNNLEMALINSLTAIGCGVDIIDSTVMGMGRGAGNLKTELILSTLQNKDILEVDYDKLSSVVSLFAGLKEKYDWGTNLAYMVSGANSLPQQEVMSQINKRFYSLNSIVRGVYNKSRGIEDNLDLEELRSGRQYEKAVIIGGGPSGAGHSRAIKTFLGTNEKVCVIHASSKNAAAYHDVVQQQFHCLVGNEGHRLETVFDQLQDTRKIAVLPPYPRTMGTYVPEALKSNAYQLKDIAFTDEFKESVTALAIETALKLQVKNIYFVGYDGYEGKVSAPEMELFKENEALFEKLDFVGIHACSLTPTRYSRLQQESVFAYI